VTRLGFSGESLRKIAQKVLLLMVVVVVVVVLVVLVVLVLLVLLLLVLVLLLVLLLLLVLTRALQVPSYASEYYESKVHKDPCCSILK